MAMRWIVVLVLLTLTSQGRTEEDEAQSAFKILPHKKITLTPRSRDAGLDKRIRILIERLRDIDESRDGLDATCTGGPYFDPAWAEEPDDALSALVAIGPDAIPILVGALTDKRKTKLEFEPFGDEVTRFPIWTEPDLPTNPCRTDEAETIRKAFPGGGAVTDWDKEEGPWDHEDRGLDRHAVTVGDCCFVALGQITNRPYEAVRAQPSLNIVVASPTRDPRIAKALELLWSKGDPRQLLLDRLLDDFHTRGGNSVIVQAPAALRLLYYFPEQTGPIVAERIANAGLDREESRMALEGEAFDGWTILRYALLSGHPMIQAQWLKLLDPKQPVWVIGRALDIAPPKPDADALKNIRSVLANTAAMGLVLDCLDLLPDEEGPALFDRLAKALPETDRMRSGRYRRAQRILTYLAKWDEGRAIPILRRYMESGGLARRMNVLVVLHWSESKTLVLELAPLFLEVRDPVPSIGGLPVPAGGPSGFFGDRICDWAAILIAKVHPDFDFNMRAPVTERDEKIEAMRAALAE